MLALATRLFNDEAGFIVSAELVLVATILVIGMVVGLSEISNGLNQELEDVASAFGSVNQSFRYAGLSGHKGSHAGSSFHDVADYCDSQFDISCDRSGPTPEANGDHRY